MKRFSLFLLPLLVAVLIFFSILFFLDRKTGKGALQVTSTPQSRVYLDGKLVGMTKFCTCEASQMLTLKDYTLKLVPIEENFSSFEEKITISKGTLTAVDRTFADNGSSEASIVGLLSLNDRKDIEILVISLPDKASVFLDGNPVGTTPLLLKQVSESDHDLRLTHEGYKDKSIRIKTALGFKLTSLVFLGVNTDLSNPTLASISATPSPTSVPASVLILNTPTGFLRVRENNSISSAEIARVDPGENYELITEREGWFEIKLTDNKTGWISSSYAVKQ